MNKEHLQNVKSQTSRCLREAWVDLGLYFLARHDEVKESYCHDPGVVGVGVGVRRQQYFKNHCRYRFEPLYTDLASKKESDGQFMSLLTQYLLSYCPFLTLSICLVIDYRRVNENLKFYISKTMIDIDSKLYKHLFYDKRMLLGKFDDSTVKIT